MMRRFGVGMVPNAVNQEEILPSSKSISNCVRLKICKRAKHKDKYENIERMSSQVNTYTYTYSKT